MFYSEVGRKNQATSVCVTYLKESVQVCVTSDTSQIEDVNIFVEIFNKKTAGQVLT